jgi:hypothetical protein
MLKGQCFRIQLAPLGYVKVRSIRLVGLVLSLFCLDQHLPYLRWQVPTTQFIVSVLTYVSGLDWVECCSYCSESGKELKSHFGAIFLKNGPGSKSVTVSGIKFMLPALDHAKIEE